MIHALIGGAVLVAFVMALRDSWLRRWHDRLRPRKRDRIVIEVEAKR